MGLWKPGPSWSIAWTLVSPLILGRCLWDSSFPDVVFNICVGVVGGLMFSLEKRPYPFSTGQKQLCSEEAGKGEGRGWEQDRRGRALRTTFP